VLHWLLPSMRQALQKIGSSAHGWTDRVSGHDRIDYVSSSGYCPNGFQVDQPSRSTYAGGRHRNVPQSQTQLSSLRSSHLPFFSYGF